MTAKIKNRITQKDRLLAIVDKLVQRLGRPVCSDDVKGYMREHPDEAPMYMQRIGQVLLKMQCRSSRHVPMHKIDIVGNRAYYALHDTPEMKHALLVHADKLRAEEGARWRIPDHVMNLLDTPYESQARNTAAGFVEEFTPLAQYSDELAEQLQHASTMAAPQFIPIPPTDLIPRSKAKEMIYQAACVALGEDAAHSIQMYKLLNQWKWPQSRLFPSPTQLLYSRSQIKLVCNVRWGQEDEGMLTLQSLLSISRYESIPSSNIGITRTCRLLS